MVLLFFISSCRKVKDIEAPPEKDDAVVENFFQIPEGASEGLRNVIADIKKQDDKYHFVNQLVSKYGLPVWNKSITNPSDKNTAGVVNGRGAGSDDPQLFLIPFQASDGSVSSYLFCAKSSDEFTYRYYKKDKLSILYAANDTIKGLREGLLSVFGFFEKKVNNKDSLKIAGIYNKQIKKVTIAINGEQIKSNARSTVGSISLLTVCYSTSSSGPQQRLQSLPSSRCMTVAVYGSLLDLGFTTDNGYSSGDGSGGGGSTGGGSSFPDGFQCPQTEWWCESGDYRIMDGVLYTPESYPGIDAGYSWLWWESADYNVSNEPDPYLSDNDPNLIWWDENTSDPNTVYTQQAKPNWQNVYNNYPKTTDGSDDLPVAEVCMLIGGQVLTKYNNGDVKNACALRVSRALNYSGVIIPNISGQTWQGVDGKNYFYVAQYLYNWLGKTFGPPDVHLTAADGAPNGTKFPEQLIGLQNRGIYIMKPTSQASFGATGHTTLWGGLNCIGGHNYFAAASDVYIWKLPQ